MDRQPADFIEFQVPFRDVDMHGEMFKSAYVARAEEALASFWKRRPAAADELHFTVGKITCSFHAALRLAISDAPSVWERFEMSNGLRSW